MKKENFKHTPGPWVYQISNLGSAHEQGLIFPEKNGPCVAVSYEAKDARLIAARPDMLEAINRAIFAIENGTPSCRTTLDDILYILKPSFKKALGE